MSSRFAAFGSRITHLGVSELAKDKSKADGVCDVHFLDGTTQNFNISKHEDGQVLLEMVFNHLGIVEREYFGLLFSEEPLNSARWLDPSKPIKKQFKGGGPWFLKFRVRFFIADPNSLQQQHTRHLYFLQIKTDIQSGRLTCPLSSAVVLASYAVQAELGDHSPLEHHSGYLFSCCFLPHQDDDFLSRVEALHLQHRGLSQVEAELCYLNTARTLDFYGVELHFARDSSNTDLLVGIASGGLAVFRNTVCSSFFSWVNIVKISFKRKRFFIQLRQKHRDLRDCTVAFSMLSYRACKNLWRSCVEHHAFFQTDSMPKDTKLLFHQWSQGSKNPAKSLNSQIMWRVMRGMTWNPVLRKSHSLEHLETRSLPSLSPPSTPSWKSPRLRHNIRKAHHSSMDNMTSEVSYLTDSEDVFYTYRSTVLTKGSDGEAGTDLCSSDKKINEVKSESGTVRQHSTDGVEPARQQPETGTQPPSDTLGGPDSHLQDSDVFGEKTGDRNSQYYFDRTENLEGDLSLVRIAPDKDGKFGFNVKGGVDQKMPLVISHVTPDSPAGKCVPSLKEGDHIVLINGRDISEHTHDQVVMFIRASRESHTKELVLLVRRKGFSLHTETLPAYNAGFPLLGDAVLPQGHQYGKNLEDSMAHLKEGLNMGSLLIQFEQLYRKKPGLSMLDARSAQNMEKNRYKDVLPYDITRVVLRNEENDYINASHVKVELAVPGVIKHYVASQGPLPHTCSDFWQAVWEQESPIIVMLTTLTERGRSKCHQYWPDPSEVQEYGSLQVCCHSEECNLAYVFRKFTLTNTQTGEERAVSHLQYVAWPDHGVPDDPTDFLHFVTFVQQQCSNAEPLVVHCSAGIGRTGVFITMETAMQLIEKDQPVYPLELVRKLRDQRPMMVQTVSQYRFICEAILRVYEERKMVVVPSTHS